MNNNIRINPIDFNGTTWFLANEIYAILKYRNHWDTIARHVKPIDKNTIVIHDGIPGNPNMTIISENGVYDLVFASHMPTAEAFKDYIKTVSALGLDGICDRNRFTNITHCVKETDIAGCVNIVEMANIFRVESNKPNNFYGDVYVLMGILLHNGYIEVDNETGDLKPTIDAMQYGLMIRVRDEKTKNTFLMTTPDGFGYFLDYYIDRRLECGFDKMINLELIACVNETSRILELYQSGNFDRMNKREKMLEARRKVGNNNGRK